MIWRLKKLSSVLLNIRELRLPNFENKTQRWVFHVYGFSDEKTRSWVALKRQVAKSRFLNKSWPPSASENSGLSASDRGAFTMKPRSHFGDYHSFQLRIVEIFGLKIDNKH